MPFQVSPGVNVSEYDLMTIVPTVSTTIGAIAGVFNWGPIGQRVLVDSENALVSRFGKPSNANFETWFAASSFLGYGNKLYVSRAANTTSSTSNGTRSAFANTGTVNSSAALIATVKNEDDYVAKDGTFDANVMYIARYAGDLGNSLRVSQCDTVNGYSSNVTLGAATITVNVGSNTAQVVFLNANVSQANTALSTVIAALAEGDFITVGNSSIGTQNLKISSLPTTPTANATAAYFTISFEGNYRLRSDFTGTGTIDRKWEFFSLVSQVPGTSQFVKASGNSAAVDEVHVVVVDEDGKFSGVPGTVLEVYKGLSRATDAKASGGASNYYKNVINDSSQYIWFANPRTGATSTTAAAITSATDPVGKAVINLNFVEGSAGLDETGTEPAAVYAAWDLFASGEEVDVSLLISGKSIGGLYGEQVVNYIIDNISLSRLDCVTFASPPRAAVVANVGNELADITDFADSVRDTSYAVIDSGYKYIYDKYNDVYRYVPLNGDVAGLCVRTDNTRDPWWSPAGFNRGQIKNIIKLAYNPRLAERDILYPKGVNPVVTFPGQGTVLYGDKTHQSKPSAFDRINVRRLFIVLEKAIARAAKYTLFEFNDDFTRSQFKNLIIPYLRDIQGRRGITDFYVVCDNSNNTGEVIDRNEFVGDIYIKPARTISFIQLNFVAVRTDVSFNEVVGQF